MLTVKTEAEITVKGEDLQAVYEALQFCVTRKHQFDGKYSSFERIKSIVNTLKRYEDELDKEFNS